MARKIRKFSAGGAQGKYDRRMADIKKDFEKDSAGKSGKALEVLAAKRAQRTADAEDDRAKRTGADRTATRAAERLAESNLTKTRKYGAPKAVTAEAPASQAKVTDSLSTPKMDSSIGAKPAAKPVQKPIQKAVDKPKPSAADIARQKAKIGASNLPGDQGFSSKSKVLGASKPAAATTAKPKSPINAGRSPGYFSGLSRLFTGTNKDFEESQARKYGRRTPLISGKDTNALITYGDAAAKKNAANKAKGGKIMKKYAKGGSTPPQPTPADRARSKAQLDSLKKAKTTPAEGKVVGSANRSEGRGYAAGGVTKEMPSSKAMGSMGMAKGGKTKMKAKAKGNPFAATKFGAAMMKKSADTEGRAMKKFAKGGSIDGIAQRGKTKTKRVTMKKGGSC